MARLTDVSLKSLGIEEKDLRRLTLAAFKKADWRTNGTGPVRSTEALIGAHPKVGDIKSVGSAVLPSTPDAGNSKAKVRLRSSDEDDTIPAG